MILRNVVVNWAFIAEPDDDGLFRLQFEINKKSEDYELLIAEMHKCMQAAAKKREDIAWWSGFKEHETNSDIVLFNAKMRDEYKDKRTNEVRKRKLPVFDVFANQYKENEIPRIANGAICNVEISPYFASFHNKYGIMLGLRSVQLMQFEVYSQNPYSDESKNGHKKDDNLTISMNSAPVFDKSSADDDALPF